MCLIIASPLGKPISEEILRDAARHNSNGCGLAWLDLENKKIQYRKALNVDELIKLLNEDALGKIWVAHFRIATVGGPIPELTHPFTIDEHASIAPSGEADAVLFQNGTFHSWKDSLLQAAAASGTPVPEQPWSDTRAVAFICHVYGKHVLSLIDNTSRFLVFDATENSKKRMMLWGSWEDHDGFKFSNRGNCAFNSRAGSGGSSSSPFQRGPADARDVDDEGPLDETTAADAIAEAAARAQTQISASTNSSATSPGRQMYKVVKRHNIWKKFTDEGLYVSAADETPTTV